MGLVRRLGLCRVGRLAPIYSRARNAVSDFFFSRFDREPGTINDCLRGDSRGGRVCAASGGDSMGNKNEGS